MLTAEDVAALLPERSIPRRQRLVLERALRTFDQRLEGGRFALFEESDDLLCRTAQAIGKAFGQNGVQVRPISLRGLINAAIAEGDGSTLPTKHDAPDALGIPNLGERWLLHGLMVAPDRPSEAPGQLTILEDSPSWQLLQSRTTTALKSLFPHHSSAFKIEQRLLQNVLDILRAWLLSARLDGRWRKTAVQRSPLIPTLAECVVYGSTLHPHVWLVLVA